MGGKPTPFRKGVGGSFPPHYSPPDRGGVLVDFWVSGGEWGGVPFQQMGGTPPRSGGEDGGEYLFSKWFVLTTINDDHWPDQR